MIQPNIDANLTIRRRIIEEKTKHMDAERFRPLLDDDDFPTRSSQWDWASSAPSSDNADGTDATTERGQRTDENVPPTTVILIRYMRLGNVASAALFLFGSVRKNDFCFPPPTTTTAHTHCYGDTVSRSPPLSHPKSHLDTSILIPSQRSRWRI